MGSFKYFMGPIRGFCFALHLRIYLVFLPPIKNLEPQGLDDREIASEFIDFELIAKFYERRTRESREELYCPRDMGEDPSYGS